jgi:hypothetical protein
MTPFLISFTTIFAAMRFPAFALPALPVFFIDGLLTLTRALLLSSLLTAAAGPDLSTPMIFLAKLFATAFSIDLLRGAAIAGALALASFWADFVVLVRMLGLYSIANSLTEFTTLYAPHSVCVQGACSPLSLRA